jgi:hypothetical protein
LPSQGLARGHSLPQLLCFLARTNGGRAVVRGFQHATARQVEIGNFE